MTSAVPETGNEQAAAAPDNSTEAAIRSPADGEQGKHDEGVRQIPVSRRFVLRQKGFSVPKPSYMRGGDIEKFEGHGVEEAEETPTGGKATAIGNTEGLGLKAVRRWTFVVLAVVLYATHWILHW